MCAGRDVREASERQARVRHDDLRAGRHMFVRVSAPGPGRYHSNALLRRQEAERDGAGVRLIGLAYVLCQQFITIIRPACECFI